MELNFYAQKTDKFINLKNIFSKSIIFTPYDNSGKFGDDIEIKYATNDKSVPYIQCPYSNSNSNKYIVIAHGILTGIFDMHDFCKNLSEEIKVNVICFEYPGAIFDPEGIRNEVTCCNNLSLMIKYMINNLAIETKNIFLVGNSLGTGVVVDYVANNEWTTPIMLISPYKSIYSIHPGYYDKIFSVYENDDIFETHKKINKITCPVKIIHSEKDTLIHIGHAKYLYNKLSNKMIPFWLNNCDHDKVLLNVPESAWFDLLNYSKENYNYDEIPKNFPEYEDELCKLL